MKKLEYSKSSIFKKQLEKFCLNANASNKISDVVEDVLKSVKDKGDKAVIAFSEMYDGVKFKLSDLKVSSSELKNAQNAISPSDKRCIKQSISTIKDFHKNTIPKNWSKVNIHGGKVGERFYPISRVGIYVPGGNSPLISTVLMTVLLAKIAGCEEIVAFTPPRKSGSLSPQMLAVFSMVGINEIYKVGGAQAIGAMAYGTNSIKPVDKIFGPGNAYVMEAKRQVLGKVGIDLLPGPSELMIIADRKSNPKELAMDLIAQAEHGTGKEALYFASASSKIINTTIKELSNALNFVRNKKVCAEIIDKRTLFVKCSNLNQIIEVANYIAPEHLELQVDDSSIAYLTDRITTAGSILQGYKTPTVLGDFTAGPSHTLPTGRSGRFFGGLQLIDFMRRSSIIKYNNNSIIKAYPIVETFARLENLDAHGESLKMRLPK